MKLPPNTKVDSRILERILEDGLTTSYKLYWFSGIFKEIQSGNQFISFRRIVCRMICNAWYPLVEYHLNFGAVDMLYDLVISIHKKYNISSDIKEEELMFFLEELIDVEIEKKIIHFYRMVPYRLLTPFFSEELRGLIDAKKNTLIELLSQSGKNTLYKIDSNLKMISIEDDWFSYIYENQSIIYGWLNYKLIFFLQRRNPNVPAIPFKLMPPSKRNLSNAKKIWKEVGRNMKIYDIYTDKELTDRNYCEYGNLSIDHFIPWSFVMHDELWNLTPTFGRVNSSKSNRLPNYDLYIEKFCEIQYSAYTIIKENKYLKNNLEDYLTINRQADINYLREGQMSKEKFIESIKSTISPLFHIAYNQGYGLWENDF